MKNHIEEQETIRERECIIDSGETSMRMDLDESNDQTISINLDDASIIELILNADGKQLVYIRDIDFDFSKDIKLIITDNNLIFNIPVIKT